MNGGSRNRLIIRACIIPTARPIRSVSATAATTTAIDGDDAEARGEPRSHQLGADDRRQGDHRPDREVDAPGDDHHRRADREHAMKRDVVGQVPAGCHGEKKACDGSSA